MKTLTRLAGSEFVIVVFPGEDDALSVWERTVNFGREWVANRVCGWALEPESKKSTESSTSQRAILMKIRHK